MLRLAGLAAKRGGQGRGTHPCTPLKRGIKKDSEHVGMTTKPGFEMFRT